MTRIGRLIADLGRRFIISIKMSCDKIIINLNHQSNQWLDGNTHSPSANADWADGRGFRPQIYSAGYDWLW